MVMSSLFSPPTLLQSPTKTITCYNSKHPLGHPNPNLNFRTSTPNITLKLSSSARPFPSPTRAASPLSFAAINNTTVPNGHLISPLTSVAVAVAKFIDMYSGILMVRFLLSWFPNVDMDRWPMSGIRDLCDPYLNLFRNIIPPVLGTFDVSPLLALSVLNVVATILNCRAIY